MSLTLRGELVFLSLSLFAGVVFGFFYDVFCFFRALFGISSPLPKGRALVKTLVVFFLDTVFVVFSGAFYIVFMYAYHSGVFRLYSLAALFCGAFLYAKTTSRLVLPLFLKLAAAVRTLLSLLLSPLGRVFGVVSSVFFLFLRKMRCFLRGIVVKYKRKRKEKRSLRATQKEKSALPSENLRKYESERCFVFGKRSE